MALNYVRLPLSSIWIFYLPLYGIVFVIFCIKTCINFMNTLNFVIYGKFTKFKSGGFEWLGFSETSHVLKITSG